jgi:hypothetical protein
MKSFYSIFTILICSIFFINTADAQITVGTMKVAQGVTTPNDWVDYNGGVGGIYVDVNTSACGFTTTPHYLVTLESVTGQGYHWYVNGTPSLYNVSPTGFRVYLRWADHPSDNPTIGSLNFPNPLNASTAQNRGWVIRWTAIITGDCAACNGEQLPTPLGRNNASAFGGDNEPSKDGGLIRNVTIFPNPGNKSVTINTTATIKKSEIYSLKGQLLKTVTKKNINIEDLTTGEYIVKIYFSDDTFVSKKLIKN